MNMVKKWIFPGLKISSILSVLAFCLMASYPVAVQHLATSAYVSPHTINDSIVIVQGERGHGTGWYVEPDMVITNYHVIRKMGPGGRPLPMPHDDIIIQLYNGKIVPAEVLRYDADADLALLYVPHIGRPFRVADSPAGKGTIVHSIGNGGIDWYTLRTGQVDRQYRFNTAHWNAIHTFLRMTIIGGFSGSPVFNTLTGEVVGVLCGAKPGTDVAIMVSHANLIKFIKGD